jgi:hypothetical protein
MAESRIFEKTEAGAEEVKARTRKLPPRLRAMLIMVDGNTPLPQLEVAAATLGAPGDFLESLLEQGLIRRREAAAAAERTVDLDLGQVHASVEAPARAPAGTAVPRGPGSSDLEARRRAAVRELNEILGPSGESLAIRMEKARSAAELGPLLGMAVQIIGNARGRSAAEAFAARHIV